MGALEASADRFRVIRRKSRQWVFVAARSPVLCTMGIQDATKRDIRNFVPG